jgi:5-bromo-4-chloroindolyl phosphate hydrolysis protein
MGKAIKITKTDTPKKEQAKILYFFLLVLFVSTAFSLFQAKYFTFLLKIGAFVMLLVSIKLLDKGLENEAQYNKEKIAFAPKVKYKLLGALLLGVDIFFINLFINHSNIIISIFLALLGIVGTLLYYGLDPKEDKIPQQAGVDMKKMLQELQEAQKKLNTLKEKKEAIKDTQLEEALDKAIKKAQHILETIKSDPKDIRVARKFILIYLDGIKDVIEKYHSIDKEHLDDSFRVRLIELLELASSKFDKELDRLKSNEVFDLDVQIDALKKQLKE